MAWQDWANPARLPLSAAEALYGLGGVINELTGGTTTTYDLQTALAGNQNVVSPTVAILGAPAVPIEYAIAPFVPGLDPDRAADRFTEAPRDLWNQVAEPVGGFLEKLGQGVLVAGGLLAAALFLKD